MATRNDASPAAHDEAGAVLRQRLDYLRYQVRLVSVLSRLGYRNANRTFNDKTVVEIAKSVLDEAGVSNYEFRIKGNPQPREIAIQYR